VNPKEPKQLTNTSWYDESEQTVVFAVDRVTVALDVEEFLDFYNMIQDTKEALVLEASLEIGAVQEDDETRYQFIPTPDIDDYN